MSAVEIVHELRQAGAVIEARGTRLHIDAPKGLLTPEKREALKAHKAELLSWLSRRDERAIVAYRLTEAPHLAPIVVGAAGESFDDVVASLRRRYGDRLLDVRPYRAKGAA